MVAAFTQLRLARSSVADMRLPWERRYEAGRLTPVRVHRLVSALLGKLGTPAKPPKPCGRSPERPRGRHRAQGVCASRSIGEPDWTATNIHDMVLKLWWESKGKRVKWTNQNNSLYSVIDVSI